jgi:tetratricopeptide (TPR) repeat protein
MTRTGCSFLLLFIFLLWVAEPCAGQDTDPASGAQEQKLRQAASKTLQSLAVAYYEKRNFERAIGAFEDALKYDPDNGDLRTNLSMLYLQVGRFDKVIETLTPIAKMTSDQRMLTALAVASFAQGKYADAVPLYEELVQRAPADAVLKLTLAVCYRLSDRSSDSDRILQQLPRRAQTQAQYHVILADAYRSQQQLPAAIAEYEKAIALAPDLPDVNYRLGVLHSDLHASERAVEAFQRELRINSQHAGAAYSMGAYFLNYGNDLEKARQHFENVLRVNSSHAGAYLGLMKILLAGRNATEALRMADKAESAGIVNDELHYLKSRAFNLQGKKELAAQELKRFEDLRAEKAAGRR